MLALPEAITHTTAVACLAALSKPLAAESVSLVVDAAGLKRFDSAALAVLLEMRRSAFTQGKTFSLLNVPVRLQDLARLYGIAELLTAPRSMPA